MLLFGVDGDRASGSGRSIPAVSLHRLLSELAPLYTDFGGHSQAVGASLPASRFEAFRREARELFAARVPREALDRVEEADAELELDRIGPDLAAELSRLEPHGTGNPAPLFLARGVRAAGPFVPVGTSGVRGRLATRSESIRAIAWRPEAPLTSMVSRGDAMDLLYRVEHRRGYPLRVEILAARPEASAS